MYKRQLLDNINFLELIAACIPLLVWGPTCSGLKVIVLSDNTQTVSFLNRGTTKNAKALLWLKAVFYSSLKHNFRFSAVYSAGVVNVQADALSRLTESSEFGRIYLEHKNSVFPGTALDKSAFFSYPNEIVGKSIDDFAAEGLCGYFLGDPNLSVESF